MRNTIDKDTFIHISQSLRFVSRPRLLLSVVCWFIGAIVMLTALYARQANAQEGSDIYVGALSLPDKVLSQKAKITNLERVTDNMQYTNQPYFFSDTQLYFTQAVLNTEQSNESTTQTEIFLHSISSNGAQQTINTAFNLSNTKESEYSPTPLPNGEGMSVIRVNSAGKQELWALSLDGKPVKHLAQNIEPIGYQVWLNGDELLLFVLGEPHTLQRASATDATQHKIVDENIGASLFQFKDSDWFLYSKGTETQTLMAYNLISENTLEIATLPKGSQYFSVSPKGHVITSNGEGLYFLSRNDVNLENISVKTSDKLPTSKDNWRVVTIENGKCSSAVSRTAISPSGNNIALVCPH